MVVSNEYVKSLSELKTNDTENKMFRLKNIITFDKDITKEDRDLADKAGITLYTMEEIIFKGKEVKKQRMDAVGI